jgi:hypothetical protein
MNNDLPHFEFQRLQHASQKLVNSLRTALTASQESGVSILTTELDAVAAQDPGSNPVTLSLVGQYGAGKSTLIKCLTQNEKIVIDADVCTDQVTAYDWDGLRVVDTPGVHAGMPAHDELTERQLSRTDLLVFVITGELFGDDMAVYFRELAFARGFAPKMMLVVNKMDADPGAAETKRKDIEIVTEPMKLEDFRTVFASGEIYLDALREPDAELQADLIRESGIMDFMRALDLFARDCGLLGALTSPVFAVRTIASQAAALCEADQPEERAALELLGRRSRILRESRSALSARVQALLNACLADLSLIGDNAAGEITPAKNEPAIKAAMGRAEEDARKLIEKLREEVKITITGEQERLKEELNRLAEGDLAKSLRNQIEVERNFQSQANFQGTTSALVSRIPVENLRKISEIATGLSTWTIRVTTGAKGVSGWNTAAAAGSQAHKAIYTVGKFFGYSFQPWEAVGFAAKLSRIGKVLGPIAALLQVVGQVVEEKMEDDEQAQFQNARSETRAIFRDGAVAVRHEFLGQFERFLNDFFGRMQSETDALISELTTTRSGRSTEGGEFTRIVDHANDLIAEIETALEA